ncbi:hypothetical protein COX24_03335 [bacterium (Candidatus Gribaldobacteria) CG23_combo_of_CG06-09_8_20_14_all_37_87_8]|uniref:Hydroxyacid dehydrogenase n=1 Tax=bacterium (Candidatus Gribaldobacteria) CG23_combo_of_CG06-09_8_20_14_all_37_87_8 TaxID=2014278 RepID=A0A2G9ZE62_9BACT|nr:MAG: hypothetical protein COX24_03335 [bacterium (Candidatus Gribaldobacteria) CG23_combo_of_CG06-09_8_20_14_all_37_87_8]
MIVFVAEKEEIHQAALHNLKDHNFSIYFQDKFEKIRGKVDVLFIKTYTKADKAYLANFPNLKFLLRAGVGLDNVDREECERRKIKIFNSPGSNTNSVAEFVLMLILMLLRKVQYQSLKMSEGEWRDKKMIGEELKDKTLGLVGCGEIGSLVAEKLSFLGVKKILGFDPYLDRETLLKRNTEKEELKDILEKADIISLHLPLNKQTKGIIGLKEISFMKRTSYLINTSRGGIVNEKDLIIALKKKLIMGAALDVFENEPKVKKGFFSLKNIVLTPHIAAFTEEANKQMSIQAVENFLNEVISK